MTRRVEVKIDFKALSEMARPIVESTTDAIAAQCGDGYVGDVTTTDRPHGAVRPDTYRARASNGKHNTLLKAVQSVQL